MTYFDQEDHQHKSNEQQDDTLRKNRLAEIALVLILPVVVIQIAELSKRRTRAVKRVAVLSIDQDEQQ